MEDVLDRAKSDQSTIEKLMEMIPGYKSYRSKEDRHQADKIQREYLAKKLDEGRSIIDEAKESLLSDGTLDGLEELDNLCKLIEKNGNRIRFASYGESGLFSTVKVSEADLERIHTFDLSLLEAIESVLGELKKLSDLPPEKMSGEVKKTRKILEKFSQHFDQRENMLKGVQ